MCEHRHKALNRRRRNRDPRACADRPSNDPAITAGLLRSRLRRRLSPLVGSLPQRSGAAHDPAPRGHHAPRAFLARPRPAGALSRHHPARARRNDGLVPRGRGLWPPPGQPPPTPDLRRDHGALTSHILAGAGLTHGRGAHSQLARVVSCGAVSNQPTARTTRTADARSLTRQTDACAVMVDRRAVDRALLHGTRRPAATRRPRWASPMSSRTSRIAGTARSADVHAITRPDRFHVKHAAVARLHAAPARTLASNRAISASIAGARHLGCRALVTSPVCPSDTTHSTPHASVAQLTDALPATRTVDGPTGDPA